MKTIGFFNNKGGVGKTSLVYHIAWMLSELGIPVVAADFDPQANLTSAFLPDDRLEDIWTSDHAGTVYEAIGPLIDREGDILEPRVERIGDHIGLVVGDLRLSKAEDLLSQEWPRCLAGDVGAFRVTSAFYRLVHGAGEVMQAEIGLIDVGPNLGAINRVALLACDHVVIPLGADLYSLQGLRNVGPALRSWRSDWQKRRTELPAVRFGVPAGTMSPAGYVVMRHSVRLDRPAQAYGKWMARIPGEYAQSVLGHSAPADRVVENDPHCLALLKDYRSLMPLAQEARKPMFLLKPADGAFGGHQQAVTGCYTDFRALTLRILASCGLAPPSVFA